MLIRSAPSELRRRILTGTTLAGLVLGSSLLLGGTASASTVVANGCTGSVSGIGGDQVAVSGPALRNLVRQGAQEAVGLLGLLTVQPEMVADAIAKKSSLSVGQIPQTGQGSVTGKNIGSAVAQALTDAPGLGLLPDTKKSTLAHIQAKVAANCGLATSALAKPAPSSGATSPTNPTKSSPAGQPRTDVPTLGTNTPGQPSTTGTSAENPTTTTTTETSANTQPAGTQPSSGAPGTPGTPGSQGQEFTVVDANAQPDIHNAGQADALAASTEPTTPLPIFLAVLALAVVSGALVRTWILRKS